MLYRRIDWERKPAYMFPPASPPMVWYPRRPSKIHHLHAMCSISESRPPICLQFAAFQSPNLRLAPYLQHLKAICYLHTTYVPLIVSICFFLPGILIYKPSHSVSTYGPLVASDWYITCFISIYNLYTTCSVANYICTDIIHIYTIIYNLYSYATSKTTRPPNLPPQGGEGNHLIHHTYIVRAKTIFNNHPQATNMPFASNIY